MLPNFLLVLASCLSAFGGSIRSPETAKSSSIGIWGGDDANITDYPYQVAVFINGEFQCGGSILNERFVLSAAHCFYQNPGNVTVRVGSSYQSSDGQLIGIKKINSHPDFDLLTVDNDISILELETSLTFGDGVRPVQLPANGTTIVDNEPAICTGWGYIDDNGDFAEMLQVVSLPLYSTDTCKTKYQMRVTENMFCAGAEIGKDSCSGDSGGPLVADGVQLGIVSWGFACGQSQPGVYTKITQYLSYIDSVVNVL